MVCVHEQRKKNKKEKYVKWNVGKLYKDNAEW